MADGRKPDGTFAKGTVANPGGRPKLAAEVRALAQEHSKEAIMLLVDLMRNSPDEKTRKAAADSLLDRGIGKPTQTISGGEDDNGKALGVVVRFVGEQP